MNAMTCETKSEWRGPGRWDWLYRVTGAALGSMIADLIKPLLPW